MNSRPVEMPVQRLAFAIGNDIHPRQRIAHGEQRFLVHGRGEEHGELRPFIDPERHAVGDLIAAHRVIDRFNPAQGRMIGGQARNILPEIDVVRAAGG